MVLITREKIEKVVTPLVLGLLTFWYGLQSWTLQLYIRLRGYTVEFPKELRATYGVTYKFRWSTLTWKAYTTVFGHYDWSTANYDICCVTLRMELNFSVPYLFYRKINISSFPDSGELQSVLTKEPQATQNWHILIQRDQTVFVCKDHKFWILLRLMNQQPLNEHQVRYFQDNLHSLSLAYGNASMNEAKTIREYRKSTMFIGNQNPKKESDVDTISIIAVNRAAKQTDCVLQITRPKAVAANAEDLPCKVDQKLEKIAEVTPLPLIQAQPEAANDQKLEKVSEAPVPLVQAQSEPALIAAANVVSTMIAQAQRTLPVELHDAAQTLIQDAAAKIFKENVTALIESVPTRPMQNNECLSDAAEVRPKVD